MTKLADRIRARLNDAPMPTEHMLDDAADALDAAEKALELALPLVEKMAIFSEAASNEDVAVVVAALAKLRGPA